MSFLTPAKLIANLDQALGSESGSAAALSRRIGNTTSFVSVNVRVRLAGYSAVQLVGPITQEDRNMVMSPTPLTAAGAAWPGAAGGYEWPRKGDLLTHNGKEYKIEAVDNVSINDVVVVIKGRVRG